MDAIAAPQPLNTYSPGLAAGAGHADEVASRLL
jgi:hypothetical protein